jgi:hypothetical protein
MLGLNRQVTFIHNGTPDSVTAHKTTSGPFGRETPTGSVILPSSPLVVVIHEMETDPTGAGAVRHHRRSGHW